MAGDINGDRQLEPEHIFRVKVGQGNKQTRCTTSIRQLIQHSAKARA